MKDDLNQRYIIWKFNLPSAPWMDGVMESMIKITKRVLKSIVRDEAQSTFLTEVESIINSRPLTAAGEDNCFTRTRNWSQKEMENSSISY